MEGKTQMKLGIDTWFLFALKNKDRAAEKLLDGRHTFVVSTVSIFELFRKCYQHGMPEEAARMEHLLLISPIVEVVDIDLEISKAAARYSAGLGLSSMDSLILAVSVIKRCDLLVTGDPDFDVAAEQKIIKVCLPEEIRQ